MGSQQSREGDEDQTSYWQMARAGYDELVNAIIRPPRAVYGHDALGPAAFRFCERRFVRKDLVLVNQRGLTLQCSHWEPLERPAEMMPCIVYVHGNSSARIEVLNNLAVCLAIGATVFAFDCAGSGKSEGRYVSLGWYERDDLRVVIDHLRGSGTVSSIAVWGRSMGAVTGILYQARDLELLGHMSVDAMVLDSPFADFCQLAEELVDKGKEHGVHVPKMVMKMALHMIKGSVQRAAGFSITDLVPVQHANACTVPALFITAENDDFISPAHAELLYEAYAGAKNLVLVEGDHNSQRTGQCLRVAAAFLSKYMKLPATWALPNGERYFGNLPWRVQRNSTRGRMQQEESFGLTRERQNDIENKVMGVFWGKKKNQPGGASNNQSQNGDNGDGDDVEGDTKTMPNDENRWKIDQAFYYCNRGNTLEEAGNIEGAIRAYRAAVSYLPTYADAYYNLGIALKSQGRLDEAIVEYENAIRYNEDHADAHNNLGVAWEEKGYVEDAVECYRRAMKAKPEHGEAHCNLADALQSLGRLDEAIKEYQIAISYNSQDADAINNMGVALEAQGQIDAAIQAYTTSVAHNPQHWDAQCNLADALHARGQLDTAISLYRTIIKNCPNEASVYSSLGNALHANNDIKEAIQVYRKALEKNETDAVTHNNLGIALQSSGQLEEAMTSYTAAIRHNPNYAIAHYNLGVARQSMDDLPKAIEAYKNAITCQKDYPDAYNNMGYALMTAGSIEEAIAAYRTAIHYRPGFESAKENLQKALDIQSGMAKASSASTSRMSGLGNGSTRQTHMHHQRTHENTAHSAPKSEAQETTGDDDEYFSLRRLSTSVSSLFG